MRFQGKHFISTSHVVFGKALPCHLGFIAPPDPPHVRHVTGQAEYAEAAEPAWRRCAVASSTQKESQPDEGAEGIFRQKSM